MKVSFDFDGTLTTSKGIELLKKELKSMDTVYILTARNPSDKVEEFGKGFGITKSRIIFTSGHDKWKFIKMLGIDKHYDNNQEQIDKINQFTKAKGIKI